MILTQCDGGCGRVSPKDGLYVSGGWVTVTISGGCMSSIYLDNKRTYHLCEECATGDAPDHTLSLLAKIANRVRPWFFPGHDERKEPA